MRRFKLFFRKRVLTLWLFLRAWTLVLLRRPASAASLLARGLLLAPDSFPMHMLLGRIHLLGGRRHEALREFSICYHLDPSRFMKQSISGSMQEEVALEAQIPADPEVPGLLVDRSRDEMDWDLAADAPDDEEVAVMLAGTDFSSVEEFRRFAAMDPIGPEEVAAADIQELIDRLAMDFEHGEKLDQG